jgi:hypothetical protein
MKGSAKNTEKCLNCSSELSGKFCSNCGQKSDVGRITFKETISAFLSASFGLEGPLLYTIKGLIVNPGRVFREYMAGRRKTYYKPVTFFVLTTALYIVIRTLINFDPLEGQLGMNNTNDKLPELAIKSKQAARFMVAHINHILISLVFAIAFMSKLFFWNKQNLAEYTAIGFLITGMYILFDIPQMFINKYTRFDIKQLQLILLALYIMYCLGSFFRKKNLRNLLAYFFIGVFSILLYMILGFGLSFAIVFLKN